MDGEGREGKGGTGWGGRWERVCCHEVGTDLQLFSVWQVFKKSFIVFNTSFQWPALVHIY